MSSVFSHEYPTAKNRRCQIKTIKNLLFIEKNLAQSVSVLLNVFGTVFWHFSRFSLFIFGKGAQFLLEKLKIKARIRPLAILVSLKAIVVVKKSSPGGETGDCQNRNTPVKRIRTLFFTRRQPARQDQSAKKLNISQITQFMVTLEFRGSH